MVSSLKEWLSHPATQDLAIDDPRTTERRRAIIQSNGFLRRIYAEWHTAIARSIPGGAGGVLELGSGAGYLDQFVPNLITSEVFLCPGIQVVLDGRELPFRAASLRESSCAMCCTTSPIHAISSLKRAAASVPAA